MRHSWMTVYLNTVDNAASYPTCIKVGLSLDWIIVPNRHEMLFYCFYMCLIGYIVAPLVHLNSDFRMSLRLLCFNMTLFFIAALLVDYLLSLQSIHTKMVFLRLLSDYHSLMKSKLALDVPTSYSRYDIRNLLCPNRTLFRNWTLFSVEPKVRTLRVILLLSTRLSLTNKVNPRK